MGQNLYPKKNKKNSNKTHWRIDTLQEKEAHAKINAESEDPEDLQALDETNVEWVRNWKKITRKLKS